ncbi:MAG: DEAD/DEAH box helicase [Cytophagales bacterium]|nr:DEAD/DEAH box helicase [Cytophagales bacterium]
MEINKILTRLGIESLNAMQEKVLETALESRSLNVLSPTGSGKTLAYLLSLLRELRPNIRGIQALVIVPSRELALQVEQVFRSMGTGFKINCCYGGHSMKTELNNLSEPPTVLVGTPGRLADHFRRESINPSVLHYLVLDEFDKSLELGFQSDMENIISQLSTLDRRILTSATKMESLPEFAAAEGMQTVDFLEEKKMEMLKQQWVRASGTDKLDVLFRLICQLESQPAIVFCNHRQAVQRISELLMQNGLAHGVFHGGLEQDERERELIKFRNGSHRILLATDLAARGLDIPEIKYIVHYQLPETREAFVHRNGRTARMNASGTSFLVLAGDEQLPEFVEGNPEEYKLGEQAALPSDTGWVTLYISGGKKDKINKIDIVGFFMKKGKLDKADLGRIDVLDKSSFAAVRKEAVQALLKRIRPERLKKKKLRYAVAK